uniref:NADH dehydrogenase subunit 4 n=1 Tax=Romanomermis culicivorax TaxID=13658 RepID=A0A915KZE3_ROMCU
MSTLSISMTLSICKWPWPQQCKLVLLPASIMIWVLLCTLNISNRFSTTLLLNIFPLLTLYLVRLTPSSIPWHPIN